MRMADDLVFQQAIEKDDITNLTQDVVANYLKQEGSRSWEKNPLRIACDYRSVNCAKEIVRLKPDLAWQRNQDGCTIMHFICETANVTIVKAVVEVDPHQLCLLRDSQFRTLLHIVAAINGKEEVLSALLSLCPQSIEKSTALRETALHLALKNNHFGCFKVLMEELSKLGKGEILNRKDIEGNTVLQISTSRKQIQILKMLLSYKSTNGDPVVEVNSRNKSGFTALDLHYQNISDRNDKDISDLLHQAGAKEGHLLCSSEGQTSFHESTSSVTKPVLLGVFIFVAGAEYASLFNLNNIYPLEQYVGIATMSGKDMIMAPNLLPDIFMFMVFNTFTFMGSVVVILINTWSLVRKWSFCYRVVPLFVMGAMFVSYALVAKKVMPKFWVTIGSHKISSFWVMWLYDLPLLFIIVIVWLIGKQILSIFSKPSKVAKDKA